MDSWRYRTEWRPLRMSSVPVLTGTWLVVTADGIADGEVTAALAGHGAQVRRLELDESCVDRAELASRLQGVDGIEDIRGMVSVLAFAEQPSATYPALPSGLALSLALVQALDDIGADARLWCLTRGAVSTGRSDRLTSPMQAQVLAWAGRPRWSTRAAGAAWWTCPPSSTSAPRSGWPARSPGRKARTARASSRSGPPACSYGAWCAHPPTTPPPRAVGSRAAPLLSPAAPVCSASIWPGGSRTTGPKTWC
ncbi:hypothetical protein SAZ11_54600 [Streptomyces sp. FXJ1.4098]|nr:hypothetical protein [Streptomyces sp. FXJ1.4098]